MGKHKRVYSNVTVELTTEELSHENDVRLVRVFVTPVLAEKWLRESEGKNWRNLRADLTERLVLDMRAGKWDDNGETIKFDQSGIMTDGQHRMRSVVETGWRGWMSAALDVYSDHNVDCGGKRSVVQYLTKAGVRSAALTSALCSLIALYRRDGSLSSIKSGRGTLSSVELYMEEFPDLHKYVMLGGKLNHIKASKAAILFIPFAGCNLVSKQRPFEIAETFMDLLASGAGLEEDSPVLILRNMLIKESTATRKAPIRLVTAWTIKAWNAFVQGKKCTTSSLRFRVTGEKPESFPDIL